ncbi:hypothetical protein L7F22_001982 [Adiantum nelumboides]|nr:hypothetical protein [Adiantum nelumboides]
MRCLNSTSALSNTNSTKISALEENLINSLREISQGRDVETAGLTEDEIHDLGACILRLNYLFQVTDLSAALEDDDNGRLSSAWEIIIGLASRGRLGYREERKMIEDALKVLTLYLTWQTKILVMTSAPASALVEDLLEKRTTLLDLMLEFVGGGLRQASSHSPYVQLHIYRYRVSSTRRRIRGHFEPKLPKELRLTCEDETQFRCAGFVQAEMERYHEQVSGEKPASSSEEKNGKDGDSDSDMDSDEDEDGNPKLTAKKTSKKKKPKAAPNGKAKDQVEARPSRAFLERELVFCSTISQFITAIRVGVVDIKHGTGLLAQFGRLSTVFDACLKILVETLREQGVLNGRGEEVCKVILDSIKEVSSRNAKAAATPKKRKASGPAEDQIDDDEEEEEAEADALLGDASASVSAPASRPKPKPKATAAARAAAAAGNSTSSPKKNAPAPAPTRKRPRDTFFDDEPEEQVNDDLEILSGAGDLDGNTDADAMDLEQRNLIDDDEEVDILANLGADEDEEEAEPSVEVSRKKTRKVSISEI